MHNLSTITLFALRYALWRHSCAPSVLRYFIQDNINHPELLKRKQDYIEEIEKHLAEVTADWSTDTINSIDLGTWQALLTFLKNHEH